MFPSSNNGNDPIFYSDQPAYSRPFFDDITTTLNSKQEEPPPPPSPLSIFHLPSAFYPIFDQLGLDDDYDFFPYQSHDLLLHQQQPQQQQQQQVPLLRESSTSVSETTLNMVESSKNNVSELTKVCSPKNFNGRTTTTNTTKTGQQIPIRKRASKRDRHSKINTAQGPRDRRMRLSLKVARDFFDLQDKLGFDKASKTVEWLLSKARPEIKKLPDGGSGGHSQANNYSCSFGTKSASSTSECEVVSAGIDVEDQGPIKGNSTSVLKRTRASLCVKREKKPRTLRKTAFNPSARESREKARARARERTKEKIRSRGIEESKPCTEAKSHELSHLSSWSTFETGEESATQTQQSQNMNVSLEALAEVEAPTSNHEKEQLGNNTSALIENSLMVMEKWSPSAIFGHQHNSTVSQERQFTDYQSLCKPWDAYNNIL